jgi:hypothetical protein
MFFSLYFVSHEFAAHFRAGRGRFEEGNAEAVSSLSGVVPSAFAILASTVIVTFLKRRSTWLM